MEKFLVALGLGLMCFLAPPLSQVKAQSTPEDADRSNVFASLVGPFEDAGVDGYGAVQYFSSDKFLTDDNHFPGITVLAKTRPTFGDHVGLYLEGRMLAQDLHRSAHDENARTLTTGEDALLELREGYFDFYLGDLELRLGKQIIVWGRADEINPTDWFSARDLTLLLPDSVDNRLGIFALKADYYLPKNFVVTAVWAPIPTVSTIPLPTSIPGIEFEQELPAVTLENSEFGFKIDRTGGKVEWSLAYFTGFNRLPEVGLAVPLPPLPPGPPPPGPPPPLTLSLKHHRIHGVGGDFVTTFGKWGLRGEAAYVHTENPDGERRDIQTPYFFYVLGVERNLPNSLSVIVQYYGRYIVNLYNTDLGLPDDEIAQFNALFTNELDTVQNGVSLSITKKWWNDTLAFDIAGALNFERTNGFFSPKLTYAITDVWKATVGGEIYKGEEISQFGFLEDNSTAFVELRRSF